ncbi:hypothetical protein ABPG72_020974 [Tetrahymena utriculariae]
MSNQYNVYRHEQQQQLQQPYQNGQNYGNGSSDINGVGGQYDSIQYSQQPQSQQNQQYPDQYASIQTDPVQAGGSVDYQQGLYRNNNETAKTFNTEMRRKYPVDKLNKKSEWIGVEKHLSEVNDEIRKNEIEINRLRQKELLSELDKKMMQQLQQKQQELNYKKREHEEVLRRMAVYQEELARNRDDRKVMQQNMAEYYQRQREEQQRKDQEYKLQKNDWENKLLEYNQQRIAEEQRRNKEHKEFLKNAVLNDYQRAQARKVAEKQNEMQNKMEYNDLIQMNAERELTKEENYKNFYRMAAENQQKLHENHFNNVYMPLVKKQRELEDLISKGVTEAERRRLQNEIDKIQKQRNQLVETKEKNQYLMGEKKYQNELEKNLKGQQVKERLQDLQNLQEYQTFKKQEEADSKKKYKDFLDQQYKEKQDILMNEQRMTRNEKGLNRLDLQAYKMYDNGLYTMLPGWAPQIGQLPPRQNREVIQEQIMDKIRKQNNTTDNDINNSTSQSPYNGGASPIIGGPTRTLAKAAQNSLIMQSHPNLGQYQKIGEPDRKYEHPVNYGQNYEGSLSSKSQNQPTNLTYGHNPIYNPMPFNNQNPYISKEFQKAVINRQIYRPSVDSSIGGNNSQLGRYPEPLK